MALTERQRAYKSAWRKANRDKENAAVQRWRTKHREHVNRKSRERYHAIVAVAHPLGGICEVCGSAPTGKSKRLDRDHDHVTGAMRGFLCRRCNVILGQVNDDAPILKALAAYLEKYNATVS